VILVGYFPHIFNKYTYSTAGDTPATVWLLKVCPAKHLSHSIPVISFQNNNFFLQIQSDHLVKWSQN